MIDGVLDALTGTAEAALNRLLTLDSESKRRLEALEHRLIEIRLAGFASGIYVTVEDAAVRLSTKAARAPDAVIAGTPLALLQSSFGSRPEDRPAAGGLEVSGDTDAAGALRDLFSRLDIDWEEQLSRLTGDIVAHQIGNLTRELRQWTTEAHRVVERDIADYLREEARVLSDRYEVESFSSAVDMLRADVDRLEQRLERLSQLAAGLPRGR